MFLKFGKIILSLIYMIKINYSKQESIYYVIDPCLLGVLIFLTVCQGLQTS